MVIDTSALLAILLDEPERAVFNSQIASAGTLLEAGIALEAKKGEAAGRELDLFIHRAQISVIPVDLDQTETARHAWRTFGKGRHPAGLNFGDCFSYALAKTSGEPLLAKGHNFPKTDHSLCLTS